MELAKDYKPEFESLKELLLDIAQERSQKKLLSMVVNRLAARPHIALARIWLVQSGDICPNCPMREECPDQTRCLHLVASAGASIVNKGEQWNRVDGEFRRFPIGTRKVGEIAQTGQAHEIVDIDENSNWMSHPQWAKSEEIVGYAG